MLQIEYDGQKGFFLTTEEHEQLKNFFNNAQRNIKVIQNADNS